MADNQYEITLQDVYRKLLSIESNTEKTNRTIEQIKVELKEEKDKVKILIESDTQTKGKIVQLDNKNRKNNILVFGLPPTENILENISNLQKILEINLQHEHINNIYEVGENKDNLRRPVKIELVTFLKKVEILRNTHRLKGTNIYINNDLSVEDRKINKKLRQYLNEARRNNIKATIKQNSLIVDNIKYTLEELESNPQILACEIDQEIAEDQKLGEQNNYYSNKRKELETPPEQPNTKKYVKNPPRAAKKPIKT
ncbi:unnamed protein product [Phaedon cochleariae]|uniref:Endonuclease-reverse transcriptase n=1 Tax=Phaedon cochleariae TaxID=80249 RepID=A0A9N9SDP6_PHACE|nr:unnamed protein product [Phaedon cochleariae]